jgi:HlyD family secretion protein
MKLAPALVVGLLASAAVAADEALRLDGEVFARSSAALLPPSIDELWNLNITQLHPDGAPVKQGDVVVVFDGGETQKRLLEKQSALKEKQTQWERLRLDLAERERNERLATEQQRATLEKARRKATQPVDLLRRVDYQKLVIEREQAEAQMALTERRETLAAEQRRQELRLIESELALLQQDVKTLQEALGSLTLKAPRDGMMLHKTNFQGEKFDVGAQVFRGMTVAEIPDLATIAVRAQLPERHFLDVSVGQPARVMADGGAGRALAATVQDIAPAVRSKSRVQPIQVLDVILALEGDTAGLKPGQTVRVELEPRR